MNHQTRHLLIALVLLSNLTLQPTHARAQGTAFTYDGRLIDSGSPANGNYDLQFTLFNAATNGTALGSVTNAATGVTNGLFLVTLDFGGVFNGSNYWLEIATRTNGSASFTTLSPRQAINPTPYALYSANAGSASTATSATSAGIAGSANSVAAANIAGTLQLTQLPVAVVRNNQSGVTLSGTFNGNGAGLTSLNAANLTGANALPVGVLPANVALLNSNQTFNGVNIFNANVGLGISAPFRNFQVRPATNRVLGIYQSVLTSGVTIESVNDANSVNEPLEFRGSPNVFTTGNVGVGKVNPATILDVNGTITLSGNFNLPATTPTSGIIYSGTNPVMHAYGSQNFFAGAGAGNLAMTGTADTGIGFSALNNNTTGFANTGIGQAALSSNTIGNVNTAVGYHALTSNTNGFSNTAIGAYAMVNTTTGDDNTASGEAALSQNTVGNFNTASGFNALYSSTSGNFNTANGATALYQNTTGSYNNANGAEALKNNTTGIDNTANGLAALYFNTTGSYNTANGNSALYASTSGTNNIAHGYQAGMNITTGNNNIEIGNLGLATDNNVIRIGASQTQAFIAGVITGDGSGLTNLNAGQLPSAVLTNNANGVTLSGTFSGNGAGLTNLSANAIVGGLTTNFAVLVPGGGTNTLCFTNGVLMAIQ